MFFDRIKTNADIKRNANGAIQCGDSHWSPYSYRSPAVHPVAEVVIADTYGGHGVGCLYFVCRKHAGIAKAQITKGSYSGRGLRIMDELPETAALNVDAYRAEVTKVMREEEDARTRAREAADRDYARQGWDAGRASYNAPTVALGKDEVRITNVKDDSFGRVYVVAPTLGRMTPSKARLVAAELFRAADKAQAETDKAVKP